MEEQRAEINTDALLIMLRARRALAAAAIQDAGLTVRTAEGALLEKYLLWHRQANTRHKWLTAEKVKTARAKFHRTCNGNEITR